MATTKKATSAPVKEVTEKVIPEKVTTEKTEKFPAHSPKVETIAEVADKALELVQEHKADIIGVEWFREKEAENIVEVKFIFRRLPQE